MPTKPNERPSKFLKKSRRARKKEKMDELKKSIEEVKEIIEGLERTIKEERSSMIQTKHFNCFLENLWEENVSCLYKMKKSLMKKNLEKNAKGLEKRILEVIKEYNPNQLNYNTKTNKITIGELKEYDDYEYAYSIQKQDYVNPCHIVSRRLANDVFEYLLFWFAWYEQISEETVLKLTSKR